MYPSIFWETLNIAFAYESVPIYTWQVIVLSIGPRILMVGGLLRILCKHRLKFGVLVFAEATYHVLVIYWGRMHKPLFYARKHCAKKDLGFMLPLKNKLHMVSPSPNPALRFLCWITNSRYGPRLTLACGGVKQMALIVIFASFVCDYSMA